MSCDPPFGQLSVERALRALYRKLAVRWCELGWWWWIWCRDKRFFWVLCHYGSVILRRRLLNLWRNWVNSSNRWPGSWYWSHGSFTTRSTGAFVSILTWSFASFVSTLYKATTSKLFLSLAKTSRTRGVAHSTWHRWSAADQVNGDQEVKSYW